MVFFVARAKRFTEFPWAWMPFTWIPFQCTHFAVKSSPYPSALGRISYCLAGQNGKWVVKTPQTYSWMKLAALRANSCVCTPKLSNFDRRKAKDLDGFLCIHFRLVYKCCHIMNYCQWKLYRLFSLRKHKPSVKQSIDKNWSNRFLTSAARSHIYTSCGRYLYSKTPSGITFSRHLFSIENGCYYSQNLQRCQAFEWVSLQSLNFILIQIPITIR